MEKQGKRLSKALAAAGVASRRTSEELIFSGRVTVNGEVVTVPQTLVNWGVDRITVDGEVIQEEESKVCYMLNKPKGFLCTSRREGQKKIVLDLFPEERNRLFTVGRLDKETEGLILVTNDGIFANQVIHPSSNITKEYLAKTDKEIGVHHLKSISEGIELEGAKIIPTKVTKVRKGTIKVAVKEGKKHEVRLLIASAGLEVLSLKRTRIGGLQLGNLPLGEWKLMTEKEKEMVLQR